LNPWQAALSKSFAKSLAKHQKTPETLMPLLLQLESLAKGFVSISGDLPLNELNMASLDELIEPTGPLEYDLIMRKKGDSILLKGSLIMWLKCECARCLQPFDHLINLRNWSCLLPLKGEDSVQLNGDTVDLTPHLREDTFLAFPQHPLCGSECGGVSNMTENRKKSTHFTPSPEESEKENIWEQLDKLDLK